MESPGPQGDPSTPNEALNPYLPIPFPHGSGCQDSTHGCQGGSVAHLSGSIATTEVVLLGKPADDRACQLQLLHLQ